MNSKSPAPPSLWSRSCPAALRRSFVPALLAVTGLFASTAEVGAQQSITSNSAVTQDFSSLGSSGTATLPTGFKVGTNWATGSTATTLAYGTSGTGSVNGTSSGGVINWANGVTASSTDRSLGFLTTGSFTTPTSIVYAFTNNTGSTVTSLALSWNYEKLRSGSRAFDWTFFHGSSSSPTTAATSGNQSYGADANNTVISNPPLSTSKSVSLTGLSIANGTTYYLRWTYTGVGGTSNAQGLAIDDFSITATGATAPAAPTITGITPGDQQLSVAFTAGADGGSAITNYKYSTDGGSSFTAVSPAATTSPILITGLTNGTAYNVQIKAVNAIGDGTATASTSGTPRTTPSAPTITTITPGNELLSVAFTAGADGGSAITNYKYSIDNGANFITRSPASTASPLVISGLTNATAYDVKLLAINAAGDGAASTAVSGTPEAPVTPTITASGSLGALTTTYGTASSTASFSVSGAALSADLVVTAPSGFAVSTSASSGFASSVNLTPTANVVPTTTVYVRLAETSAVGSYSGNVSLTSTGADPQSIATTSSSVTPASLTITGLTAAAKEYDGTTTASVSGTPAFSGLFNGDDFSPTGTVTWEFTTKTAGTAKALTRTGDYAASSANYTVTQPSLSADITTKALTVTDALVTTRPYNAGTVAAITGATLSGIISPDVVSLTNSTTGTFAQATVGTGISVTTTMGLTGADAANYTVTQPTLTGEIIKADQSITFAALPNKYVSDASYSLTATASSGLPVSFSSPDTGVLTITGSNVTLVGIGTATITASQAGDGNYNAATSVDRSQVVTPTPAVVYTEGLNNSASFVSLTGGAYYSGSSAAGDRPASSSFVNLGTHSRGVSNGTAVITSNTLDTSAGSVMSLRFRLASFSVNSNGNGADAADNVKVAISTDNGTTWKETLQINGNGNACWSFTSGTGTATTAYDGDNTAVVIAPTAGGLRTTDGYSTVTVTSLPQSPTLKYRITALNDNVNERWLVDTIEVIGIVPQVATPVGTPAAFTTTYGTTSSPQTFSVSGSMLQGNLTATAPSGFEVSADGTTYGATANFVPSSGTASGTLHVRLSATAAAGDYNSVVIPVTSTGAIIPQSIVTTSSGNTVSPASLPSLTFTDGVVTGSGGVASFSYAYVGRNGTTYTSATAPTAAGFYTVTATSTDPNFTGSANNDYFVTGPIAANDSVTKPANNSATQYTVASLLANDTRIDGTGAVVSTGLSITAVTSGSGNTATLSGSDVLFTPSAGSPETFTYTLSDGTKTTEATVTVTAAVAQQDISLKLTAIGTPVFAAGNTTVTHGFLGEANQSCVIQYSTDLQTWISAGGFTADSSGVISVEFTASGDQTTAWKKMFFRASQPPN